MNHNQFFQYFLFELLPGFYYLKLRLFLKEHCPYYVAAFIKGSASLVSDLLIPARLISNNSSKVRLLFEEGREEVKKLFTDFFNYRINLI